MRPRDRCVGGYSAWGVSRRGRDSDALLCVRFGAPAPKQAFRQRTIVRSSFSAERSFGAKRSFGAERSFDGVETVFGAGAPKTTQSKASEPGPRREAPRASPAADLAGGR